MQICENIHEFKGHGNILSLKPWTDCQGTPVFFICHWLEIDLSELEEGKSLALTVT